MKYRGVRIVASLALALGLGASTAETADVAVLLSSDVAAWRPVTDALRAATAGHTLTTYDLHGSRAEAERLLPSLKGGVAVMVAMGPLAAEAARALAADVPLVYCMVQDPASIGSLQGPNVTGVAFSVPIRNQLAAFRVVNPRGKRIGVVYNSAGMGRQLEEARRVAAMLDLELVVRHVAGMQAVPQTVRELLGGSGAVDALWIPPEALLLGDATRRFIMQAAVEARKPIYAPGPSMVKEGALVSNSPEPASIGQSAGELVNRIVRGEKAEKLSVAVPRAEVAINKRIADQLGLAISAEALRAAHRVF